MHFYSVAAMKNYFVYFSLSLAAFLCSCDRVIGTETNSIEPYRVVDLGQVKQSSLNMIGTGKIQFLNTLSGINSSEHYVLSFRLLEANSELKLVSHTTDIKSGDGVELRIFKNKNNLEIWVSTPGFLERSLGFIEVDRGKDKIEGSVEPENSGIIHLRLEIHNGVSGRVEFYVWHDWVTKDGYFWNHLPQVKAKNAVLTNADLDPPLFSHGRGLLWGLKIHQVEILAARREAPYVD
jgi:hypothetical protein